MMHTTARLLSLSALVALSGPALAQAPFIEGVYAKSTESCTKAKTTGLDTVFDAGETVLTSRGIEGIEFHCDFLDVQKGIRSAGWRVGALCEEPGYAYPETLAIMPRAEGELDLTTASDLGKDDASSGSSVVWYRCEGVALP